MYEINEGNKYRKSFKRIAYSGRFPVQDFKNIIRFLGQGKELPTEYHDHALTGDWSGVRECHLSGDCLLLYEVDQENKSIRLINIGNHANMFE